MRFSPTKLLHGLLYTAPVMLLTLVACGGGGGSSDVPFVPAYTLGGAVTDLNNGGLVLRNNGGDDVSVSSGAMSYVFSTSVVAATDYNVTILTHPNTPLNQRCSILPASASGVMPASNVTNVDVTCVDAYTIGGNINNLVGTIVLQNDGADNLLVAASGASTPFTFSTPVINGTYPITVLTQPHAQNCTPTSFNPTVLGADVTTLSITCVATAVPPPADSSVYTANYSTDNVAAYTINAASGTLSPTTGQGAGSGPSSIAVDAASHVYVTNLTSKTITAYDITPVPVGGLNPLADVDAGTPGFQGSISTGPAPVAITIHPSGKFAYVANSGGTSAADANSVSGYSIDAATGALARIDTNGTSAGTQYFIPARVTPNSIAIHPNGSYAYVTNLTTNNITLYSVNATTGALTEIETVATGTLPYSIAIDPAGTYAYVTSWSTDEVWVFTINPANGKLTVPTQVSTGTGPRAVAIHPTGKFAYVVNSGAIDNVSGYKIVAGGLFDAGVANSPFATGSTDPISISIDSSGQYAYVVNYGSLGFNGISAYSIDSTTGELTLLGSYATGSNPYGVATAR